MAPENETEEPYRLGTSHAVLADEMSDDRQHNAKKSSSHKDTTSIQEILRNSLDQAGPMITEKVEEIGTMASKTLETMREWSIKENDGGALFNPGINFSAEQKIASLAGCCKLTNNVDDTATMITYETEDEHAKMIQRLTSWNTMETSTTFDESDHMMTMMPQPETKKCVHFDYPPVQAMSEIPRVRTQEIPSLFYTEEELFQLRGDQMSTFRHDNVEVVSTPEGESVQVREDDVSAQNFSMNRTLLTFRQSF